MKLLNTQEQHRHADTDVELQEPLLQRDTSTTSNVDKFPKSALALSWILVALFILRVFALIFPINDVHVRFEYDGSSLMDQIMMTFSFSKLVSDFWKAGAGLMSGLIVIGSCIHPFTATITLLSFLMYDRFLPFSENSKLKTLFKILIFGLELTARFSLVDVVFQSFLQIVLHTDVTLIDFPLPIGRGHKLVDIMVALNSNPRSGIYLGFCVSITLISMFRCIEYFFFGSRSKETFFFKVLQFVKAKAPAMEMKLSTNLNYVMMVIAMSVLFSLHQAFSNVLITFQMTGFAGEVIGENASRKEYVTMNIPSQLYSTRSDRSSDVYLLSAGFLATVILLPMVQAFMCFLWLLASESVSDKLVSMKPLIESFLDHTLSFSGLESLFCACVAGYLEMALMTKFIVSDQFPGLCRMLHKVKPDLECIDLENTFGPGFYWLAVAAFLKIVVVMYIYFVRA